MSPKKAKKDGDKKAKKDEQTVDETDKTPEAKTKAEAKAKPRSEAGKDSEASIKCIRTELPQGQRQGVYNLVVGLYSRDVEDVDTSTAEKKRAAHVEFAKSLKGSLDLSLGLNWHVLVGCSVGFACKKRSQSMGMYKLEKGLMAIVWKSPAAEGPVQMPMPKPKAKAEAEAKAKPISEAEAKAKAKEAKVLKPSDYEADSPEARAIALIRQQLQETPDPDSSDFPQDLRRRLTKEEGPIWHVLSGPQFSTCVAHGCRSRVLMESGQTQIMVFQHEQVDPEAGKIQWGMVLKAVPYLLAVICAFGYMTLSSVCNDDPASLVGFRLMIQAQFCTEDYQNMLYTFAAICFGCIFLRRGGSIWEKMMPGKDKDKLA